MQTGIDTYSIEGLRGLVQELGEPAFRAGQILEWLYGKGAHSFDEMTNLPAALREKLAKEAPLFVPRIEERSVSQDGTRKYVMRLFDNSLVETVGIPSASTNDSSGGNRLSVCVSSQVGCAMGCSFCATGQEGFTRNLTPGEMVWQLLAVAHDFGRRINNVVIMGQGEPFLNYDNTLAALRIMNNPKGPGVGARHISVSTCGIPEKIKEFGTVGEQFTLAVSLHSARQGVRDVLMPNCAKMPLDQLKTALLSYQANSGRRVSFEYLLIDQLNSAQDDLDALVAFCSGLSAYVNLLPINPVPGSTFKPCKDDMVKYWIRSLKNAGIEAAQRHSRGSDIAGACGQLKNSFQNKPA